MNRRMVIDVFAPSLRKLWKEWELRLIILLSLICQIILMLLGHRRRYKRSFLLQIMLWSAYFAADSLATFALGAISSNLNDAALNSAPLQGSLELQAFWTPFFLLHLGGVETITAYSIEDNDLWLRQLLGMLVKIGLVIYVLVLMWSGSQLSILSILMLVAGIINYGERTYDLWCASNKQRKVRAKREVIVPSNFQNLDKNKNLAKATRTMTECLFADFRPEEILVSAYLSDFWIAMANHYRDDHYGDYIEHVELGLATMYESLYTKTKVNYSAWGTAMRCISILLTCISLVLFFVLNNQDNYSKIDVSITFALLTMAVLMELYGAFVFLTSYTTLVRLGEHGGNIVPSQAMKSILSLRTARWSNSMGQYSMTSYWLGQKPARLNNNVMELVNKIWEQDEVLLYVYEHPVKDYVKGRICEYLSQAEYNGDKYSIFNSRGRVPLKFHLARANGDPTTWLDFDAEFGDMVTIWHIVTEICYYLDHDSLTRENMNNPIYLNWKIRKYLSRYLMHLYVVSSDMLPRRGAFSEERKFDNDHYFSLGRLFQPLENQSGTSNLEEETNRQAVRHELVKLRTRRARVQACKKLRDQIMRRCTSSELDDASKLMNALLNDDHISVEYESKLDRNWTLLSEVWMELLASAANQCRGKLHAQHLTQGGELLTHVWVLLGHFGLIANSCRFNFEKNKWDDARYAPSPL